MNTYLFNYIKRDMWLANGRNFGLFLREQETIRAKEGITAKKAKKIVKRALWQSIRKSV